MLADSVVMIDELAMPGRIPDANAVWAALGAPALQMVAVRFSHVTDNGTGRCAMFYVASTYSCASVNHGRLGCQGCASGGFSSEPEECR